jgi:hypothetical protein
MAIKHGALISRRTRDILAQSTPDAVFPDLQMLRKLGSGRLSLDTPADNMSVGVSFWKRHTGPIGPEQSRCRNPGFVNARKLGSGRIQPGHGQADNVLVGVGF